MIAVQRIGKEYEGALQVALKYFQIILLLSNIHVTQRELELIAYTSVKGNISSGGAKEGFCKEFNSSKASIGNMVYKLHKQGLLVKEDGRTRVVSSLNKLDFNNKIILQLTLNGKQIA